MEEVDYITDGCLKFLCCDMTVVDMGNLVSVEKTSEMTGHLMGTQMSPIGKNRQQLSQSGVYGFGVVTRDRTEMAREVRDDINACENVEQVSLWDFSSQSLIQLFHPSWGRFGLDPFERRLSLLINRQIVIPWSGTVDRCRCLCQPLTQI